MQIASTLSGCDAADEKERKVGRKIKALAVNYSKSQARHSLRAHTLPPATANMLSNRQQGT